ncbi:hypothetical protein OK016_25255 [Vibrio chagasii]|nr:hypothetical protein [Vibrio chagasii]
MGQSKQQLVTQLTSKDGWDKPMVLIDGQEVIDDSSFNQASTSQTMLNDSRI